MGLQIEAIEFLVLLCVAFKFALQGGLWMKPWCVTIQMKAIEQ